MSVPRPKIPPTKDILALLKGAREEGILSLTIRFADGTEIEMNDGAQRGGRSALELWRSNNDATS